MKMRILSNSALVSGAILLGCGKRFCRVVQMGVEHRPANDGPTRCELSAGFIVSE